MVLAPAGEFHMGSQEGDPDESPVHTVKLAGFWIDRTEVTNGQYAGCVAAGGCQPHVACAGGNDTYGDSTKGNYPVCVTWQAAEAYCTWAGARLPTEAEWEYAARGGAGYAYAWGDAFEEPRLNFCDSSCSLSSESKKNDAYGETAPVQAFEQGASWCGAWNMNGNVAEWVADWYDSDYYGVSDPSNPQGPQPGASRVARGGSYLDAPDDLRSARRRAYAPDSAYAYLGFRCAKDGEPTTDDGR